MGPDQHAQLDGFSYILPFPYRVAIILVAGFWGWGANLQYLLKNHIDLPALIRYPSQQSSNQQPPYVRAYRLASILSFPLVISFLIFLAASHGNAERIENFDYIPQATFIILLIILIQPFRRVSRTGRYRFLITLKRISVGGLAEPQDGKFGDILLADALTSYAKVLADLYVSFCMFFTPGIASTSKPDRNCGKDYIVPIIVAVPSIIRLRQCLTEYLRVRRAGLKRENKGGQHLANALKYASAFPVIILGAKLKNYNPLELYGFSEMSLSRLLYLATFVNSAYCFYWDVAKDWDLSLFSASRTSPEYPYGLRRHRYFSDRQYYFAIWIDLVIRFSWVTRFLPSLAWLCEKEIGLFILFSLEVARRWMWIFLRAEAESVRNSRGPAPDDILLGEFSGKIDAD